MSSDGDGRLRNLPHEEGEDGPVETAGDLYAPDTTDGGSGDISEPAKATLRAYMKSIASGNGPQSRGEPSPNSKLPPEEGQTHTEGLDDLMGNVQGVRTRMSSLAGRDTWVVGHKGTESTAAGAPPRDPFSTILGALKESYPLGRYVPAADFATQLERPGTLESSLSINLDRRREKAETIGSDPGHQTARTEASDIAASTYSGIHDAVSHALSYNRFSPTSDSPFVVNGKKTGLGWAIQRTLGAYNPNTPSPSDKKLREVGARLSYLQTGHKDGGNWTTVLPTLTQMGLGSEIDLHDLQQVDALITETARSQVYTILDSNINDGIGNQTSYDSPLGTPLSIKGDKTYGVLNSFHEPFEGSLGIFLIVAIQLVALIVVGFLLELLFGDFFDPGVRTFDHQGLKGRELAYGRNKTMDFDRSAGDAALEFVRYIFGVPDYTQHKFGDCFMEGLMGFYGVDPDDIVSDPAGTFLSLWESSGFYAIVIRLVSQDMFDYPEIAAAFDGKTDQVSALMKTFNIMKSSHTIKFVMTMVKLGDQILAYEDGVAKNRMKSWGGNYGPAMGMFMGAGSSGGMMLGSLRLKSLSNRFGGSALGNAVAPSAKKLTDKTEAEWLGEHLAGTAGIYRHSTASDNNPTFIDTETRQRYERILDATFCPFYFHDLRTNEIVSFHAFLTNLNDSYQANFEDITGHGRVEPAKVYQSTTRSISLAFKVVAATPEDVDAMYLKLNRLVAMCYPQYTAGRAVDLGGNLARAPYSQMPASTPLLRLRVGDIITSNASQLGLARLHGALDSEPDKAGVANTVGTDGGYSPSEGSPDHKTGVTHVVMRGHERMYYHGGSNAHPTGYSLSELLNFMAVAGFNYEGPYRVEIEETSKRSSEGIKMLKIKSVTDNTGAEILLEAVFPFLGDTGFPYHKDLKPGWEDTNNVGRTPPAGTVKEGFFSDEPADELCVPVGDVAPGPSADSMNGAYAPVGEKSAEPHPYINNDPGAADDNKLIFNNPAKASSIIKSFSESGGRGLPGVITSIDFGNFVDESTVWGSDRGYRAPRMLEVTVSFSVVHDIPPGLDSSGQLNSAIYGVGASKAYNKGNF